MSLLSRRFELQRPRALRRVVDGHLSRDAVPVVVELVDHDHNMDALARLDLGDPAAVDITVDGAPGRDLCERERHESVVDVAVPVHGLPVEVVDAVDLGDVAVDRFGVGRAGGREKHEQHQAHPPIVATRRAKGNTERPFTLAALAALWILGCGGAAEREPVSDSYKLLECGALPDPEGCCEADPAGFGEPGNLALVCDGWPDNPFGETDDKAEFFQVVYESGVRGVVSRVNGETVCKDRWK